MACTIDADAGPIEEFIFQLLKTNEDVEHNNVIETIMLELQVQVASSCRVIYKCFEILDSFIHFDYFEDFQGVWLVSLSVYLQVLLQTFLKWIELIFDRYT